MTPRFLRTEPPGAGHETTGQFEQPVVIPTSVREREPRTTSENTTTSLSRLFRPARDSDSRESPRIGRAKSFFFFLRIPEIMITSFKAHQITQK
jgi:hypothetical protein